MNLNEKDEVGPVKINWVDILIVIYITRAFFLGKKRGLSVEFIAVIIAFLSWIIALHFYQPFGRSINTWFLVSEPAARAIAFSGVAFGMLFIGTVLGRLLKKIMKLSFSSGVEKVGGLAVGGIRGVVVAAIIIVSAVLIPADFLKREVYTNSLLGNYLVALSPKMHEWGWVGKKTESRFSVTRFWKGLPQKPKGEIL